jgi:type IV pilus assembly protein PilY1
VFALDVTSPLHPVLLWHLDAATEKDDRWDACAGPNGGRCNGGNGLFGNAGDWFSPGTSIADPGDPATYALKWSDGVSVDYFTTDNQKIFDMKQGRYNYADLGQTYSTAVAKVWAGSGFQYMLFVATNAMGGSAGAEVFAIDLVTGQKQWQWEHLYDADGYVPGPGVDNGLPPRMALGDIDANGSTERIYVGDLEGHVWELYSRDGRNVNYLKGSTGGGTPTYHSFPLFGTAQMTGADASPAADPNTITALYEVNGSSPPAGLSQQPLTTPIGQGRFTLVPTGHEIIMGRLALVVGTMGVDWSIAPYEKGHLFVLPVHPDQGTRLPEPIDLAAARDPMMFGVLSLASAWDIPLGVGERVYGMPRVINNLVLFNTAFGSFSGDITDTSTDPGNLWVVGTSSGGGHTMQKTVTSNDAKSFGGVVQVGNSVVASTDTTIKRLNGATGLAGGTSGGVGGSTFNRSTPAILKSWEVVP